MKQKKALRVYLDQDIADMVAAWAKSQRRSLNSAINYLVWSALMAEEYRKRQDETDEDAHRPASPTASQHP